MKERKKEEEKKWKILLVEDKKMNQVLAVALLKKKDWQVKVASNGQEALEILAKKSFDLILMDVQMPEMDGIEATAHIRKKEEKTKEHIPIIAMTAHAMKGDREKCLAAGMDDYISKPFRAQIFYQTIEELLRTMES